MSLRIVRGLCFAVLVDLAIGLFFALLLGKNLNHRVSFFEYGAAMFFALLPDFDVLMQKKVTGQVTGTHKNVMHSPLIMLPLLLMITGAVVISFNIPNPIFWWLLGPLCVFGHYAHDTFEEGPGIAWFAPFSHRKYRFRRTSAGFRAAMTSEELQKQERVTMEEWLEREYLQVTQNSTMGVVLFGVMMIIVLIHKPPLF